MFWGLAPKTNILEPNKWGLPVGKPHFSLQLAFCLLLDFVVPESCCFWLLDFNAAEFFGGRS
jgi:hypothetical protein